MSSSSYSAYVKSFFASDTSPSMQLSSWSSASSYSEYVQSYFTSEPVLEETPEVLQEKLRELRQEFSKTPPHHFSGDHPSFLSPEFLALFLRTEKFRVKAAAYRYRKYWEWRVRLFGDEAGRPFTAEKDRAALELGFLKVVPGARDKEGRQILLANPGNLCRKTAGSVDQCRACWYLLHAALEDPETAKTCSVVIIAACDTAKFSEFNSEFDRLAFSSLQGALPVRVAAIYLLYVPSFFKHAWAVLSTLMTAKISSRAKMLSGTPEAVRISLLEVINADMLPQEVGGPIASDVKEWVQQRIAEGN